MHQCITMFFYQCLFLVPTFAKCTNVYEMYLASGALLHPLCSHLQLWLAEVGDHPFLVNGQEIGNLLRIRLILDLSLFFLADRDKVLGHVAHVHHTGSVLEHLQE